MRRASAAALAAFAFVLYPASMLPAQRNESRKVDEAVKVFQAITKIPEKEVPDYMMKDAYGIAIIPGVQKAAFIVGGQYGKGVLVTKNPDGAWGSPVFITLTGGSIGWQIGVQSIDLLLFFRTKKSVDGVLRGSYTLGVDVAVAAGSLGRQAGAGTDTELKAEILSYARTRGLFAGVMLAGAKLEVDDDADAAYYGKSVQASDVVGGTPPSIPASASELKRVLDAYKGSSR